MKETRSAISQSNYIPWKGYFQIIDSVDIFVYLDNVQFTRRDWRNRNRIKTQRGLEWLTVPVETKGRYTQNIEDTVIVNNGWQDKHIARLSQSYRECQFFNQYIDDFSRLIHAPCITISRLNQSITDWICDEIGITTRRVDASSLISNNRDATGRLVDICKEVGANEYLTGPAAKSYIQLDSFTAAGVKVHFHGYGGYQVYSQPWGGFVHEVSILDLLFSCGPDSLRYIRA